MNRMNLKAAVSMMMLSVVVAGGAAYAAPADSYINWSYGSLRVADIQQRSDNDVHVRFRDSSTGALRSFWPNYSGTDICGGSDSLYLSRGRTNFKEMVDALNAAGLAGRLVWVGYEPYNGKCYIKAINVTMQ